jgi:hypothetical protein
LELSAIESSISTIESGTVAVESKLSAIEVLSRELAVSPSSVGPALPGGSTGAPPSCWPLLLPGNGAGVGRPSLPRGSPSHRPWMR